MTHDYKAALKALNDFMSDVDGFTWEDIVDWLGPHLPTTRHALLIADRVMGEPSEGALAKGTISLNSFGRTSNGLCNAWRVMRDQIIKEVTE